MSEKMKAIAGIGKCGCVLAGAMPNTKAEQKRYEDDFKSQGLRIEYRDSITLEFSSHSYGYCKKMDARIKELEGLLQEALPFIPNDMQIACRGCVTSSNCAGCSRETLRHKIQTALKEG